jgi:choline dehydrogenase-like flavoprotein
MNKLASHYTVVVIGSGFGGTMTALTLARKFKASNDKEPANPPRTILMLERGTWWTTPVGTVQDREVGTYKFLANVRKEPVQYWSSQNHFKGVIDLFTRCFRREKNDDGLYEMTRFGTTGFWGLIRRQNDGINIVRANGVGGGSLVYSNITIRPPDLIFKDPRWPLKWSPDERNDYFDLARDAIGLGVLRALDERDKINPPIGKINTGLSNIVTRTAGMNPHWIVTPDPLNKKRGLKHIDVERTKKNIGSPDLDPNDDKKDFKNDLWIDRARVFQAAMDQLNKPFGSVEYGAVDLSINDYDPANPSNQYDKEGNARNYCERQGRCNVGCLPGARHTLNKQLMAAAHGKPNPQGGQGDPPLFKDMAIQPLAEVDVIRALPDGMYEIEFDQHEPQDSPKSGQKTRMKVTADIVIVAAGCIGTNEIMLRSKDRGTLPNLSDTVGLGFSTNGDYAAFLENTNERVRLTRGPVTTSFGHFNLSDTGTNPDEPKFHTLEDNGIPPAFASLLGIGVPLIRSLANGRSKPLFIIWTILRYGLKQLRLYLSAPFKNARERQEMFKSEDELSANIMLVVGMGREASMGQFRLGKGLGDTPLRVKRTDSKEFHQDPVYDDIRASLDRLADILRSPKDPDSKFFNPFLNDAADALKASSISLTHPLGGCRMAENATKGVVDEYGRVFDKTKQGKDAVYKDLYIADAAIIPTALGVNPSLTISALALRIADNI